MTSTILTYHHIDNIPDSHSQHKLFVGTEEFRWQMEFLKRNGFTVVSLEDIRAELYEDRKLPSKSVAISFDDGFEDNYLNAFPIIREYGYPATIFMIAERIPGVENASFSSASERYLSLDQMHEMMEAGITIGSHGMKHKRLAAIPPEEAKREIIESRRKLEQLLECPIRWFCYPFGSFNKKIVTYVYEAGYVGALSVIRDNRVHFRQIYFLPRVMVMPGISIMRFRYYFSNLYHYLHSFKNRKRWDPYIKKINLDVMR